MREIVNHPQWADVEDKMHSKMAALGLDLDTSKPVHEIGMEAMANLKAYRLLEEFLKEMDFYKGEPPSSVRRDMR